MFTKLSDTNMFRLPCHNPVFCVGPLSLMIKNTSIWKQEMSILCLIFPELLQFAFSPNVSPLRYLWAFRTVANMWNRMLPLTSRHIIKRDGIIQPSSCLSALCSCLTLMVLDASQEGSAHTSYGTIAKVNWKIY